VLRRREGSGSGAVDLESKPGMGVGHYWDWEVADRAEGDSLKVLDCLGKMALAALMVGACWECMVGAQAVHLLDPLAEQAWLASGSLGFITRAMETLLCPFCWCRICPKGAWSEPSEARS
jgi:hypothetical protein